MRQINHSQLRNDSGRVLRELKNGEAFEVTNDRELVGFLLPVTMSALDRARISARSSRPSRDFRAFEMKLTLAATPLDDLVSWNKGSR